METICYAKIVTTPNDCNKITPLSMLSKIPKEIFKKLHAWLLQDPQRGHHPHLLDLGHLDGLALAVVNIFEKFLLDVVQ